MFSIKNRQTGNILLVQLIACCVHVFSFFAVDLRFFPPGGYVPFTDDAPGNIRDLILPMITLGTASVAVNLRQIRASMIEVPGQDYVRTARARGLSERRVSYLHALREYLDPRSGVQALR